MILDSCEHISIGQLHELTRQQNLATVRSCFAYFVDWDWDWDWDWARPGEVQESRLILALFSEHLILTLNSKLTFGTLNPTKVQTHLTFGIKV